MHEIDGRDYTRKALFPLWSLKKILLKNQFLNIQLKLNVKETHIPTSN